MKESEETHLSILKQVELLRVKKMALTDYQWWKSLVISDTESLKEVLIEVPEEDTGYRLIYRLRSKQEPNLLNPIAKDFLVDIAQRWHEEIQKLNSNFSEDRLSIISLFRTPELQQKLISEGANAASISAHQAGVAIDIDPTAYYSGPERKPVNRFSENFDIAHIQTLERILIEEHTKGNCNFIPEFSYKLNEGKLETCCSCFHICIAPTYISDINENT